MIEHSNLPDASESAAVAKHLRQLAPDLPAALRNRTLANCKTRLSERQRCQKRLQWQLVWTVFGVLTIQSMALFAVNEQNTQLLAGNSQPPLFASLSFSEINHLWHQRSRQFAQMMPSPNVG